MEIDPFKDFVPKGNAPAPAVRGVVKTDPNDLVAVKAMTWRKLVETLDTMPAGSSVLPLAREIMDRIDGKPAQSVHVDATVKHVTVTATIRFADQPLVIENEARPHISGNASQAIEVK